MKSDLNFNRMFGSLSTLIALSMATPLVSAAYYNHPDAPVTIERIKYGGTGCPQGTAAISIADDQQTFTAIFDQYVASLGPGIPLTENRKACQLDVNFAIPPGWSYTIFDATYRGYTSLDYKVKSTQSSTYYFSGESKQMTLSTNWFGPKSEDYIFTNELGLEAYAWSPCGEERNLQMKTSLSLTKLYGAARSAQGLITTDSIDGKVTMTFGWLWKKCY